jgi:hypothetical protein
MNTVFRHNWGLGFWGLGGGGGGGGGEPPQPPPPKPQSPKINLRKINAIFNILIHLYFIKVFN